MEQTCQIIKGFFVRRPCGREAVQVCVVCGKQVCKRCRFSSSKCKDCGAYDDHHEDHTYNDNWVRRQREDRFGRDRDHDDDATAAAAASHAVFNSRDEDAFEPGGENEQETADWGDDADVSAFDS